MGFYDDDPDWAEAEDAEYYASEQRAEQGRPVCLICGNPITDDKCFYFNDGTSEDYVCERCYEDEIGDLDEDLRDYIDIVIREQCFGFTPTLEDDL